MNIKNKKLKNYISKLDWEIRYTAAFNKLHKKTYNTYVWFNDYDCSKKCYKVAVDWVEIKDGMYTAKLAEDVGRAKSGDIVKVIILELDDKYYSSIHDGNYSTNTLPKIGAVKDCHLCFNFEVM